MIWEAQPGVEHSRTTSQVRGPHREPRARGDSRTALLTRSTRQPAVFICHRKAEKLQALLRVKTGLEGSSLPALGRTCCRRRTPASAAQPSPAARARGVARESTVRATAGSLAPAPRRSEPSERGPGEGQGHGCLWLQPWPGGDSFPLPFRKSLGWAMVVSPQKEICVLARLSSGPAASRVEGSIRGTELRWWGSKRDSTRQGAPSASAFWAPASINPFYGKQSCGTFTHSPRLVVNPRNGWEVGELASKSTYWAEALNIGPSCTHTLWIFGKERVTEERRARRVRAWERGSPGLVPADSHFRHLCSWS